MQKNLSQRASKPCDRSLEEMSKSNSKGKIVIFWFGFFLITFKAIKGDVISAPPIPPTSIEAEAPWFGRMNVRWSDDTLDEDGYYFQYRNVPQTDWITLSTLNTTIRDLELNGGSPTQTYEFRILSFQGDETAASPVAKVIMPNSFLNPSFANITYETPFHFEVKANNISNSENVTYQASPLPNGLTINKSSGIISGSVKEDGFFDVLLTATYDSPSSVSSIAKLALRIPPQSSTPELISPIPLQELSLNEGSITLNLGNFFIDPDTRKAIKIKTNKGDMVFSLFDKATPIPVQNFLDYIRNETYQNNIFHRSVTTNGLNIIQSGSFYISDNKLNANTTSTPIANEPGIANERGTIAYARTSNPDSATSGWYINSSDSPGLDVGDSYTVFGRATQESLPIIDSIQKLSTGSYSVNINNQSVSLNDFPTDDGLKPNLTTKENIAVVENILPLKPLAYEIISITNSNIAEFSISSNNNGTKLTITPTNLGTTSVQIQSTDIDKNKINTFFNVSVFTSFKDWALLNKIENNPEKYLLGYAFGESEKKLEETPHRSPNIETFKTPEGLKTSLSFYHRKFSKDLNYSLQCSKNLNDWEEIWNSKDGKNAENVLNAVEDENFTFLTITQISATQKNSDFFFRVLVEYLENN